jgi:hypothetical protein
MFAPDTELQVLFIRGLVPEEQGRSSQPQGEDKGGKPPELAAQAGL